ncbi:hypothetical protein F4678DRAFT_465322 [Xylaria arbuscula]|nr:hypothetical protein F4678DRAFT_465322 [Xylaria arbuscula]
MKTLIATIAAATFATGNVVSLPSDSNQLHPVEPHSQCAIHGTKDFSDTFAPYDADVANVCEVGGNDTTWAAFPQSIDHSFAVNNLYAFVTDYTGNTYHFLESFAGAAKSFAIKGCSAVANSVEKYLTQGNYPVSKQVVVGGAVVGLAINIVSSLPNYFINARLETTSDNSDAGNDACGAKGTVTSTSNAVMGVYKLCLTIKNEMAERATANYDVLGGFEGRAKMFLFEQAATWGDICSREYGIDWKRKPQKELGEVLED